MSTRSSRQQAARNGAANRQRRIGLRILICTPGGRYGQLPGESYMMDLSGKKQARYASLEAAQAQIDTIKGSHTYRGIPDQYKPVYKIV